MHFVTIAPEGHAAGLNRLHSAGIPAAFPSRAHPCYCIILVLRSQYIHLSEQNPVDITIATPDPRQGPLSPAAKLHPRNLQENCPKRRQSLRKHPPIPMLDRHITLASTEVDKMDLFGKFIIRQAMLAKRS